MRGTFESFKSIAELYTGDRSDLDKLAILYQKDRDSLILAVVFVELYPFIVSQVRAYFNLTDSDKASFTLQELEKSMGDFRLGKGAAFRTFFNRYLQRRMYAETNLQNRDKRAANNQCTSYEALTDATEDRINDFISENVKYIDENFQDFELMKSLESSTAFTANELKYCKIIMRESSSVRDVEVANELKVSSSAINQMKKAIRKKFVQLELGY